MARASLTDEERAAKKSERFAKLKAGRPNPSGRKGTPELWAGIADESLSKFFPGRVFVRPVGSREERMLARLGLTSRPGSLDELKKAWRAASMKAHPDHGGSDEAFRDVMEAWGELRTFY